MLSLLHIENVAVIERADITFDRGLNLLTGETGAGKSIVLDALGAVIGLRTSRDLVRAGAQTARVSAVFDDLPAEVFDFLRENGLEVPEGEELLVSRDVSCDGRGVCRVCGRPATVSLLRQLGEKLLHIHGQHDSQALLNEDNHGPILDRFGGLDTLLEEYKKAYNVWRDCERQRSALQMDEQEKARRIDHLQFACTDIESAELEPGEDDVLLSRRQLLQNAERLTDCLGEACALFAGDDETDGARSQLSRAARCLEDAAALHEALLPLQEKLSELSYAADDMAAELEGVLDEIAAPPGALDEIEDRLDLIYRLKRKYGASIDEILRYGETCREQLEALQLSEERMAELDAECRGAHKKAMELAVSLGDARRAAGAQLSETVCAELSDLEMKKVRFEAEAVVRQGDKALRENGLEDIRFLLSANPGEPLKPLSRIASGGELSRIMLALCNVLSEKDQTGAMVFDEIDAGVSGRAAGRVAEKLGRLSRRRQVLCVTHLPQIAAMADSHFRIEKDETGDRAVTGVIRLDDAGRVDEMSRLLGGLNITETTRGGAREQLAAADKYKSNLK